MNGDMSLFSPAGPAGRTLTQLGWWLLSVSVLVVLVVAGLVAWAIVRRRDGLHAADEIGSPAPHELRWIQLGGVAIPAVILVVTLAFTLGAVHVTGAPARRAAFTVEVTGHRWWWELRYVQADGTRRVVTANELHVPVGEPIRLELTSGDVIHSYWVPALNGKMDLNPGTTNVTWIMADRAGTYRGQCTEYCGRQHANMATFVVAEPAERFAEWLASQEAPAAEPASADAREGRAVFMRAGCAGCHTVRGTPAVGRVGPDLTHVASRRTIAAGLLPNTPGYLAGWVSNAPALKPGTPMPASMLRPRELHALVAYLGTLK